MARPKQRATVSVKRPSKRPSSVASRVTQQPTIDPDAARLTGQVEAFFRLLNCPRSVVLVEISSDTTELAYAQGGMALNIPFGKIVISRALHDLLTPDELAFVLAHEVAHIYRDHVIVTASYHLTRSVLDSVASDDKVVRGLLLAWDLLKLAAVGRGTLPPAANTLRANELEADAWALFLTKNKAAAKGCLLRLAGDNLDAPSHTWEVFKQQMPALSVRDRLKNIDRLQLPTY